MKANNELIAEFMGKTDLITENQFLSMEHKAHNPTIIEYLKYDTDWNELMEVLHKCLEGEAEHNDEIAKETIKIIYERLCEQDINGVYSSCIKFIEWYNKQNN